MITVRKLGICMDHASAGAIEFSSDITKKDIILSKFTHEEKQDTLSRSENVMHNKEQHQQADYYKKIADVILNYNEVVLFGPTHAKNELLNIIKDEHRFDKIKIDIQQTDKMQDNEQFQFVKEYFSK